ncbi:MAG: sigma factor-like helix-turn-helix DNA-binding protein, partial [Nitrospira sp.]
MEEQTLRVIGEALSRPREGVRQIENEAVGKMLAMIAGPSMTAR